LQNYLPIYKKVVALVKDGEPLGREPRWAEPSAFVSIRLRPDWGTMDDCNAIWRIIYPPPPPPATPPPTPNPMPLTIGHLIIISQLELDIDAVYTAEVYTQNAATAVKQPAGIALDVERVTGKRIAITAATLPNDSPLQPQDLPEQQQP